MLYVTTIFRWIILIVLTASITIDTMYFFLTTAQYSQFWAGFVGTLCVWFMWLYIGEVATEFKL